MLRDAQWSRNVLGHTRHKDNRQAGLQHGCYLCKNKIDLPEWVVILIFQMTNLDVVNRWTAFEVVRYLSDYMVELGCFNRQVFSPFHAYIGQQNPPAAASTAAF